MSDQKITRKPNEIVKNANNMRLRIEFETIMQRLGEQFIKIIFFKTQHENRSLLFS